MVKVIYLFLLVFGMSVSQLHSQWRGTEWSVINGDDLLRYIEWLDGSFSSYNQSIEEQYFSHVTIEQRFIRKDVMGSWFYIQQGMFGDEPYRKRIYIIFQKNDTTIVTKNYRIRDEIRFDIRNNNVYELLRELTLDSLIYLKNCDSYTYMGLDKNFYGELSNGICPGGSYNEATYTTSEFRVYENMIVSWERGWNEEGQRWGSNRGFYYFRRMD